MTFPRLFPWQKQPSMRPSPCATPPSRPSSWGKSSWRRRLPHLALLSLSVVGLCCFLDYHSNSREGRPFDPFEQVAHSIRMGIYSDCHFEKIEAARRKIVLVTINDSTFTHLEGPPVPRRYHAKIVRDLTRAGAKVIVFDLLFKSSAADASNDHALGQAAQESGKVLWASLFQDDDQVVSQSNETPILSAPARAIEELRRASPHEGHINSGAVALDNPVVDRISPVLQYGQSTMPSLSLQAALMATGAGAPLQKIAGGWRSGSLVVPTDGEDNFPITFLRPTSSGPREQVFPSIPYERMAAGAVDEPFFRDHKYFQGKIVLIGDSSKISNDHSPTPIGGMSGVEIHAHAIATILAHSYIRQAPAWANMLAIVFMGGIVCLLAAARRLHMIVFGMLGLGLAFSFLNIWLFVVQGWWLHMVAPLAALSLAGVGILIEDGLFHEGERERMFDAFVLASASAIESRDPATSGHSKRVTDLCVALAEAVTHVSDGPFKHARFSQAQLKELRYAGLLHDFGKIGVRENILTKSHKLPPDRFEAVQCRLAAAYSQVMLGRAQDELQVLEAQDAESHRERLEQIEREYGERLEQMNRDGVFLQRCNDPMVTFLPDGDYAQLQEVLSRLEQLSYVDLNGQRRFVITPEERAALSIRKGSLTPEEYGEIQQHSQLSYDFLKQIPWTDSMAGIPDIALRHHEKLNGSGYPCGLKADQISLPVRIMTIADIFDALTAADRPYKKAMPIDRALSILSDEAKQGALDVDLLRVFIEHKVYEKFDGTSSTLKPGATSPPLVETSTPPPSPKRRLA